MSFLRKLFRRSPIRMGSVDNSRIRTTPIRNAQFVSFISETGCLRVRSGDCHDARLRRQRCLRAGALITVTALSSWFVIESARAISTF